MSAPLRTAAIPGVAVINKEERPLVNFVVLPVVLLMDLLVLLVGFRRDNVSGYEHTEHCNRTMAFRTELRYVSLMSSAISLILPSFISFRLQRLSCRKLTLSTIPRYFLLVLTSLFVVPIIAPILVTVFVSGYLLWVITPYSLSIGNPVPVRPISLYGQFKWDPVHSPSHDDQLMVWNHGLQYASTAVVRPQWEAPRTMLDRFEPYCSSVPSNYDLTEIQLSEPIPPPPPPREATYTTLGIWILILALCSQWLGWFSEFPLGIRHPCTTMPWTIWPALAVLWGVCWMFYTPSEFEGFLHSTEPEQELGLSTDSMRPCISCYLIANLATADLWASLDLLIPLPEQFPIDPSHTGCENGFSMHLSQDSADLPTGFPFLSNPSPNFDIFLDSTRNVHDELPLQPLGHPAASPRAALIQQNPHAPTATSPMGIVVPSSVQRLPQLSDVGKHLGVGRNNQDQFGSDVTLPSHQQPLATPKRCPQCSKEFSRPDALARHMRELKHISASSQRFQGSVEDNTEFLCPAPGCKKSKTGFGFKRRDKLQQHLKRSCKAQRRLQAIAASSGSRTPPTSLSGITSVTEEGSPTNNELGQTPVAPHSKGFDCSDNVHVLASLQRCHEAEEREQLSREEDLRKRQEECRRGRERLEELKRVLEMFEREEP